MIPRVYVSGPAAPILALLLAASLACDKSDGTPTTPSGTLQVTAPRATLGAGETIPLTVTSAGAPVTGVSWVSTDTTVIAVSQAGQATAGRAGRATVTATSASAAGSLALRVVPDYNGTWTGTYVRLQTSCNAVSTNPICVPGAPTSGTVTLRVTQVGDQVTGTLVDSTEPTATVPVTGQVLADDQVLLAGRIDVPAAVPAARVDISGLRASLDVALGTVAGSYTLTVDRAGAGSVLQRDYAAQVQFRDLRRR